ncbi:MAG: glycoside hydrolase family 2 TIM barrel-domain containing protein [Phycisphaerae bacterium]
MLGRYPLALAFVLTVAMMVGCSHAAAWKPADGPLMTPFTKDVSPENALPEYPRPQMVREGWQNLNGLWDYAIVAKDAPQPKKYDGHILVPYAVESALSGVMERVGPEKCLWYHRTFKTPDLGGGKRLLLHFEGVDWDATVYLNGEEVGRHRGGYDPFTLDVTDALRKDTNDLVVRVFDPTDAGQQPRGKQVRKPHGIWYTPVTGIWRTVWMEPVPETYIRRLVLTPEVDEQRLNVAAEVGGPTEGRGIKPTGGPADALTVEVTVLDGGKKIATAGGGAGDVVPVRVPDPKLWTPDSPHLYDLKVELKMTGDEKPLDEVESYFGMRKIEIGKGPDGKTRMLLNGEAVFQVGFLDQGWWPDGLYTAATDEALKYDVEVTKQLGFNFARKHVKIEPHRWYYWCDKLGLLVWQDMPNGNNGTPEGKEQFEQELRALVDGYRNHPSIIMWVVFNEGWGQHDTERYTKLVKEMDPSRLVSCASGWKDAGVGDIKDVHSYPKPKGTAPEPSRAAVQGEFGGLGLGIPGHLWKEKHWGYRGMADREELTSGYEELLRSIYKLKDDPGISGAVYTQTSDVEIECNGLMTYDRAVIKPVVERVAAVNRGDFSRVPPPPVIKTVVPTSEKQPQTWRYTTEKPPADWTKPGFDDSGWKEGPGGFGAKDTPAAVVRTAWKTGDIWLRREVAVPKGTYHNLHLRIHHDEDARVFINGVQVAQFKGYLTEYQVRPMNQKARSAIKPGARAVIAVHCRQTRGGQFIDVGLVDVIPQTK